MTAAPPKTRTKTPTTARVATGKARVYEEGLTGLGGLATFGLMMTGQLADAVALGKHGPKLYHEVALLGESNENVGRVLSMLTEAGPYAGLITAAMPLVLQILANHGRIPAEKMPPGAGIEHPAALVAEAQADIARQQAEANARQSAAQQELADIQREREFYTQNPAPRPEDPAQNGQYL